MTSKAFEMIVEYRNKAIAVLRLQKVNGITQRLQVANSELKSTKSDLESVNKKIADVNSGEFSPSYADMNSFNNADEARAAVVKSLTETAEGLTKEVEAQTKSVADIEADIVKASKGEKPYRFSRDEITELANKLILQDGNTLKLDDVSVVDEAGSDEFAPTV